MPGRQLVDGVRTLAAAQDQDRLGAGGVAAGEGGGALDQGAAHGVAGEADLAARERGRGLVERHEHPAREAAQDPVGETGHAVLLLDGRRVARQRRRQDQRPRGVAARPPARRRGGTAARSGASRGRRAADGRARARSPPRPMRLSPLTLISSSGKPAFGTRRVSRPRSVPTKIASPPAGGDRLGDGDPGIEVAARSAARDQDPQRLGRRS